MIILIRIRGEVNVNRDVEETLNRMRLRKKYSCVVLLNPREEQLGMIKKIKDFVAFGKINAETFEKLIEKRGQIIDSKKKVNARETVKEFEKGKKMEELNLKPFFRLHPPRGGIDSKKHFGVAKGVLGNHGEKINELLERML
ncbi:MAG: uL30 family ribosomal protein [Candidatus Nanoarchaeia archaeon]|nr:uL30 family ribosomal protein [Candidatus Nanoarchaeia archaeon]